MNDTMQANVNNPVFASQYFNGTYDPTQGSVYRIGDVLSNLLDDYTGEEVQFVHHLAKQGGDNWLFNGRHTLYTFLRT